MTNRLHLFQYVSLLFNDGSVGIMQFILDPNLPKGLALPGFDDKTNLRSASKEAIEHEIAKSSWSEGLSVVSWRLIDSKDFPSSEEFRDAWTDKGEGKLQEDLNKCRKIHKDRLREARKPLLESLDIEYQIADEQGNQARKREVAQEKQRLRDATNDPRIEAAQTVEELKAVNPLVKEEPVKPGKKKEAKK
jgi:hypothetical protein